MNLKNLAWILGLGNKNHEGPGIPRGTMMEIRAVQFLMLVILIVLGGWFWMKKEERKIYSRPPEANSPAVVRP